MVRIIESRSKSDLEVRIQQLITRGYVIKGFSAPSSESPNYTVLMTLE